MLLLPLTILANDVDSDRVNGAISYSISAGMLRMYTSTALIAALHHFSFR